MNQMELIDLRCHLVDDTTRIINFMLLFFTCKSIAKDAKNDE